MIRSNRLLCSTAALLMFMALPALAQQANGSRIYKLTGESTFEQGCFPPCLCPFLQTLELRGTFRLQFGAIGDAFNFYHVRDVNFVAEQGDDDIHIVGAGSYQVDNHGADLHAMQLDLMVGDEPAQHFFSDLQPDPDGLSTIEITLSINGIFCQDTVLTLVAEAIPQDQVQLYRVGPPSTYQEGCWDPCDCILHEPVPMAGSFGLVEIFNDPPQIQYSVVHVNLRAPQPGGGNATLPIRGFGLYTIEPGDVIVMQQMELDLRVGNQPFEHFDTGWVLEPTPTPLIHALLTINEMFCFDRVLDMYAEPVE